MKKIINHLRSKDEQTRQDILKICTIIFAFILVLLWIYVSGTNVANSTTQNKIKQDLQPFAILKNDLTGGNK